jgi:hypothetical protein
MLAGAFVIAILAESAAFACTYCTSSLPGFKGGPGRVIYPGTPQTMPPPPGYVLAPGPEVTGDYSVRYLYSHETGRAYADPMFYHAQGALSRWREIQSRGRSVTQSTTKTYQVEK